MNGETLTYGEIIERSKEGFKKYEKRFSIYFSLLSIVWFIICYLISENLLLSIVTASIILLFILIYYLVSRKRHANGIEGDISEYKDEINEYNLVFDDYLHIITKKHLISVQRDDGTTLVRIVELDKIDYVTTKKYMKKAKYRYFNIRLNDGKLIILYLPDEFMKLLGKYIKNNS